MPQVASTRSSGAGTPAIAALNARLDRLPTWGLPAAGKAVFAAAYFFAFYDIIALGAVLPAFTEHFHLSDSASAVPLTASLAGYIIGAYGFGSLADTIGRRRTLRLVLILLALASLASAGAWDLTSFAVLRFVAGMGIGAQITLSATLITELSPSAQRGRNIQRMIIWAGVGDAVAPFIALGLLDLGTIGWRLVIGLGVLALVPALMIRQLPESPRWSAVHGDEAAAEAALGAMERRLTARGHSLPPVTEVPAEAQTSGFPLRDLLRPPYRSRLLVVTAFWVLTYIAIYGFLGYETVLLDKLSLHEPNGLLYTALGDIAFPLGAALPLLLLGRMPRKYLLGVSGVIFAGGLVILATSTGAASVVTGAFLVALVLLVTSGVGYIYTSEIFPTRARASAMGVADGVGHLGGIAAPYVVLSTLTAWGPRGAFWLLAALVAAGAVLIAAMGLRATDGNLTELTAD